MKPMVFLMIIRRIMPPQRHVKWTWQAWKTLRLVCAIRYVHRLVLLCWWFYTLSFYNIFTFLLWPTGPFLWLTTTIDLTWSVWLHQMLWNTTKCKSCAYLMCFLYLLTRVPASWHHTYIQIKYDTTSSTPFTSCHKTSWTRLGGTIFCIHIYRLKQNYHHFDPWEQLTQVHVCITKGDVLFTNFICGLNIQKSNSNF